MKNAIWLQAVLTRMCLLTAMLALGGCTSLQRAWFMTTERALPAQTVEHRDGTVSLFYRFDTGSQPDTVWFFVGGSGCTSWKAVMPEYLHGLTVPARVFALNKRWVSDRSWGLHCGEAFDRSNHLAQWEQDQHAFIDRQLQTLDFRPREVVLVGVSEGAWPAVRVARDHPAITRLVIIGSGVFTMESSLKVLRDADKLNWDLEAGWRRVQQDPDSLERRWLGHPHRWWSAFWQHDPLPDYLTLNKPLFLAMGENDQSVPVASARALEVARRAQTRTGDRFLYIPDADHRLSSAQGNQRPLVWQAVEQWLAEQAAPVRRAGETDVR